MNSLAGRGCRHATAANQPRVERRLWASPLNPEKTRRAYYDGGTLRTIREACDYITSMDGKAVDTRSLQSYLGHKNVQHTVRYSELFAERFRDFWKDRERSCQC
jgi:hypothetical protein